MIDVLTVAAVKEAERRVMDGKASEDELISLAAQKLFECVLKNIKSNTQKTQKKQKILVVYGGGNNGADGLTSAALLAKSGYSVYICAAVLEKNDGVRNREKICQELGVWQVSLDDDFCGFDVIVDAVFGFGLDREVGGPVAEIIEKINGSGAYVISADIPSGLCADCGIALGACVRADETVTFSCLKPGLMLNEAKDYCGEITVADIGVPHESDCKLFEKSDIVLKKRSRSGHKYDYGKVAVIGGSYKMPGAALMAFESSVAALKSGAGLSVLCVPQNLAAAYQCRVKECMLDFIPSDDEGILFDTACLERIMQKTDSIVIGMGMTVNDNLKKTLEFLCKNFGGTLIIDAGALGALVGNLGILRGAKCKVILTPHVGEFNRLMPGEAKDLLYRVRSFSAEYGTVTLCKGAVSLVSDGKTTYFCDFGTPALSKGGSGDVLAGIIGALSVRYEPALACAMGCYFLGDAAKRAEKELSEESVIASDIIVRI